MTIYFLSNLLQPHFPHSCNTDVDKGIEYALNLNIIFKINRLKSEFVGVLKSNTDICYVGK